MPILNDIKQLWQRNPYIIKRYLELCPKYEKLSEEIAYIFTKHLRISGIEFASITFRAKTLDSFCEKIIRKAYQRPLNDITDFAGVRVVYLYLSDRSKLEDIIEKEFLVEEKVDKVEKSGTERFGYGALHYLVRLGKTSSGARYDDLKGLICEIQVRTILQDAWSMVAHHLSYKQESDVPKELRRKLNALSGLFETADDQFDHLRLERIKYKGRFREKIYEGKDEFLKGEINLDNLTEFLSWRLSDRGPFYSGDVGPLLSELNASGYTRLIHVDKLLSKALIAVEAYENKYPPSDPEDEEEIGPFNPVGAVRVALEFIHKELQSDLFKERAGEFMSLIEG
jgi:putative GTP pyrophosphokinase